jgi:D-alanine--poly(phosphoribitol) ligase subunit 2
MNEKIKQAIFNSIEEINLQLENEDQLEKSSDTRLFGVNSNLDSLGLVNLLVIIEQNIEDEFDVITTIADERAMSQKYSPFQTVGTLTNYIEMLLKEELND